MAKSGIVLFAIPNQTKVFALWFVLSVVFALEPGIKSLRFKSIDACLQDVINVNNTSPAFQNLQTTISYDQCIEICGDGYGKYPVWMVMSALTDWVIPLFLLLGNITYSKSASYKFYFFGISLGGQLNWLAVIAHLLVNPMDFLWSLSLKLEHGCQIWERCERITVNLWLTETEKKDLSAVAYALSDFQGGKHVDTLLSPLESKDLKNRRRQWRAVQPLLEKTARVLAHARRHNKLHSVLAILMYGKDVFVALIQAQYDKSFPYHMPHTLALRQLYYWLFLAIILSGAAGGFENQWTSQDFLETMLAARRECLENIRKEVEEQMEKSGGKDFFEFKDIELESIQPWDGGNYSWMHPKGPITPRKFALLLLVVFGVVLPVAFAFYMSWSTPTVGLGDRGIMELSCMAMWTLNFGISFFAGKLWERKGWSNWTLFRMYWWNIMLAIGSLYILFGAFQGWFNSCISWSAYWSRGLAGAVLNLEMKKVVEDHIFTFYLPMVAGALVIQLVLAGIIIWMTRCTTRFTVWSDEESRACQEGRRGRKDAED